MSTLAATWGYFIHVRSYTGVLRHQEELCVATQEIPLITLDLEGDLDLKESDGLPDGILLAPLGELPLYFHVCHILADPKPSDAPPADRFVERFSF